jgi:hypothetical protein
MNTSARIEQTVRSPRLLKVSNFYYWMSCGKTKSEVAKPLKLVPAVVGATQNESGLLLRSPSGGNCRFPRG